MTPQRVRSQQTSMLLQVLEREYATPAKDQQKNAIRNMATVKGVDKDKIETVLKSISDQTAREYIAKLNKGDVSMFG